MPFPIMALVQAFGPQALELLGGQMGTVPGAPPPPALPQQPTPSKFNLGIKEGMNIQPRNELPGGGFGLGLGGDPMAEKSFLSPGSNTHMKDIALGGPPGGNVFDHGGGAGGDVAGGMSALEKLGMGAKVGETLMPKAPPPPALPGGGRFDMENTLMQWLQSMGRR